MQEINKCSGYCCDGCQWNFCTFFESYEEQVSVLDDANIKGRTQFRCKLFNAELFGSQSLFICNKIYGYNYKGKV